MVLEKDLLPWRQEGKRSRLGGVADIMTSQKNRVRSKPQMAGTEYLDIYMMTKEKERLEQFGEVTGKMQQHTLERWQQTVEEMEKAKKKLRGKKRSSPPTTIETGAKQEKSSQPFKKMSVDY